MKKIVRSVNASSKLTSSQTHEGKLVLTPEGFIRLLSRIPELQDLNMGFKENPDGSLQLAVGNTEFDFM